VIEIIVSDLGKVLLPFDMESAWKRVESASALEGDRRGAFLRVYHETDIGRGKTEPEEFHRRLVEELRLGMSYAEFCEAWSDMFWLDDETIRLIAEASVRQRHMLSNTNAIHWNWIRGRYGDMLSGFDRLWVSHEMGLEKPDPAIYRTVIESTGLPPEAHVFIDDIEENVLAAKELGMEGIVHTDAVALAKEFQRLGLR
jgi:putative hydrolase of the HAD superfamily